jgi:ankyrin repeat protein
MTHSNTTIHNIDQQNQTISNRSNFNSTSPLDLQESLNQIPLSGSRVYHLVGTFIGSAINNSFETIFTGYFLQNRGRLNSVDSDGNNALHIAIEKNDFDTAIKLIALGINRFHQNIEGLDPLEYASQKNSSKIQNLLRDIGSNRTSLSQSQSENRSSSTESPNPNPSTILPFRVQSQQENLDDLLSNLSHSSRSSSTGSSSHEASFGR